MAVKKKAVSKKKAVAPKRERATKAVAPKKSAEATADDGEEKKPAVKKKAAAKKKVVKKSAAKKETVKKTSGSMELVDIIQNWNKMNEHLNSLTEEKCLELLRLEQGGRRRVHMLNRIHARYTKLRSERERIDIMSGKDIAA